MRALVALAVLVGSWSAGDGRAEEPGRVVLDNGYVQVTRGGAPCAAARGADCGARVVVALAPVEIGTRRLARGQALLFKKGQAYTGPAGDFLEVNLKPDHPPVQTAAVRIPPEKNALLYDEEGFFVFEERLAPGDTRPRHSHSQRVVVVIDPTRLQQWPDGAPETTREQIPDDVRFNEPVVHVVKNVGTTPLRSVVIELKGR
jgi:hypothetical protein